MRAFYTFLFVLLVGAVSAQDFSKHNWYFGSSSRAIRFSRSDNTPSLVSKSPIGIGGAATASDPTNANLLFYTDGSTIYDITHAVMSNGAGLTGNITSNQPAAISPVPGSSGQYYVFTNSAAFTSGGTISYSIVDMTQFGNAVFPSPPIGAVTSKNQSLGLSGCSEAMITIPHANGTDYWLITHQNGTDIYNVTQIAAAGSFNTTIYSGVTGIPIVAGNFAYHEGTGKIAVTPQDINRDIAILNFDNSTGALSMNQYVVNTGTPIAQDIYDTEWSPNGTYLYISRNNDVLQYDTSNPLNTLASVLPATVLKSYGLQIAPDTAIYHLYESSSGVFRLGRITDADSVAASVIYAADAFGGNIDFDARQFPSFSAMPTITPTVTFTSSGTCQNSPIAFYPTVMPAADSLVWDFGDGGTSSLWSPVHIYQNAGSFNVTVTPYLNGQAGTPASNAVNLTSFSLQISLVQDTTACRCEFPPPVGTTCNGGFSVTASVSGGSPTSVVWSNGDTGLTLTPDSAGYYYLVVTDASGCSAYAGVNVKEYDAIDQRANIWYFGQNAGIDFNEQPPLAVTGPINTPEGVSVISDRNGDVIFSTDGVHVYNRNDVDITPPVPPGIGGDQGSTQSVLIFPVPGDETLYYIFTTQEIDQGRYELRYSLYDIKLNNGDGGLVSYNELLFSPSTERITGNGNWLIIHEFGNNSFRAYPISSMGIGNPVISSVGSDHSFSPYQDGQGYMKLVNSNTLAVAYSVPGVSNTIELFDFADSTGVISNYRVADTELSSGQVYGIGFAANKLFATVTGSSSTLVEFYLDSLGMPHLIEPSLAPISEQLGAIELSPSGQLYIAVNGKPYLASINVNGDTTMVSTVTLMGFPLAGGTNSTMGLPNFVQTIGNAPQLASMTIDGLCLGSPTNFNGSGTDSIDEFEWSFGDGFSSTNQSDQHTYAAAGDYVVTLRVFNRCGLDTLITQTITISGPPNTPPFPMNPSLCNGPVTFEAAALTDPDLPNLTYLWSTGETTRTITVDVQSIVSVVVTNAAGCTSDAEAFLREPPIVAEFGPDLTLCQGTPIPNLTADNGPGYTYSWKVNGISNGNTGPTQAVDSSLPNVLTYEATVTDPILNCTITESVTYTFKASPIATVTPVNSNCGAMDGQIDLTIDAPIGTNFSFDIFNSSAGVIGTGIDQTNGQVAGAPFTGLPADTYLVIVRDQVSLCGSQQIVVISDNSVTVAAVANTPVCDPFTFEVTPTGATMGTYTILDPSNNPVIGPLAFDATSGSFTTDPIAFPTGGDYTVRLDAQVGPQTCIAAAIVPIVPDPQVPLTLSADGCTSPITVTATGGTSWTWTGPNITSATTVDVITANPAQGPQTYKVTASDVGICSTTDSIVVQVNNNVIAGFTQSDACSNTVTLTATASAPGSYVYQWFRNGVPVIGGGSTYTVGTADNGVNYNVSIRNTVSGCTFFAPQLPVEVYGTMLVTMLPPNPFPCSGDLFTLSATSNLPGANFEWFRNNLSVGTGVTYQDTREGVYKVVGSVVPQCPDEDENEILPFPTPGDNLPTRKLICNSPANPNPDTREIILDAGSGYISYAWYQGGVLLSGETSQTLTVTEPGIYTSEIENSYGCFGTDDVVIEQECNPRIIAPTAFRPGSQVVDPNGNLANNTFRVFAFFIQDSGFEVFIFNRWGEMVYQAADPKFEWNGQYNNSGQLLPAGTYSYVIKYVSEFRPEAGQQEHRGGVVLMR